MLALRAAQGSGWCQESAVTPNTLIAASWYVPWEKLSDWGEQLVAAFGLLLWIFLIFSLLRLGIYTVLNGQYKWTKHKRGKHEERRI